MCVHATGATVTRRRLYRASSVGYVVVVANGQLGVAARIVVLRHANPDDSPRVPALIAAEMPILATEATFAAAGVLLTATGTIGALCFAAWALTDWLCVGRRRPKLSAVPVLPPALPAVLSTSR